MAHIIINSIPGMGKTDVINNVIKCSHRVFSEKIHSISLGEIFQDIAMEEYSTEPEDVPSIDYLIKQPMRGKAVEIAKNQILLNSDKSIIIDTPITMFPGNDPVPYMVRGPADFIGIDNTRLINSIVTLVNAPEAIIRNSAYASEHDKLLEWMAWEAENANIHAKALSEMHKNKKLGLPEKEYARVKHFLMPRQNSEISLLKMLHDYNIENLNPVVAYIVGPISDVKFFDEDTSAEIDKKIEDEIKIKAFSKKIQKYVLAINPIVLADMRFTDVDRDHTVHRDLNYFVPQANIIIGYFPGEYESKGTKQEMRNAVRIGKPVILIYPHLSNDKKKKVFDFEPTIRFYDENYFFYALRNPEKALENKRRIKFEDKAKARRALDMLVNNEMKPRYHNFERIINKHYTPFVINN